MLTEKDYCDYDTSVALKELDYPTKMTFVSEQATIEIPINSGLILLYEAQKWLREEKKMDVFVRAGYLGKNRVRHYFVEVFTSKDVITLDNDREDYDSYEEALLEGIKEAVKILKEKNINQRKAIEAENTEFNYGHNVNYNERDTY